MISSHTPPPLEPEIEPDPEPEQPVTSEDKILELPEEKLLTKEQIDPADSDIQSTSDDGSHTDNQSISSDTDIDQVYPILRYATWIRKMKKRKTGNRTDVYFYEKGSNTRLRTHAEVKRYCEKHNLIFIPNDFSFSTKVKLVGEIQSGPPQSPSTIASTSTS